MTDSIAELSSSQKLVPEDERRRKLTVELGCGSLPLSLTAPKETFSGESYYVGVDLSPERQKRDYSKEGSMPPNGGIPEAIELSELFKPGDKKNRSYVFGDFNHVPIGDASVDEVYMANVFNDPRLERSISFKPVFGEAKRLLKPGGRLTVSIDAYPVEPDKIKQLILENGFEIESEHFPYDPKGLEFIKKYNALKTDKEGGFIFVAVPKNQ